MSDNNFEVTNTQAMFNMFTTRFKMDTESALRTMENNGFDTEGVVTKSSNQVGCESKDFFSGYEVS